MEQKTGPDTDREDPPAPEAGNVMRGTARSVLQTGTHHGDTIIHAPPERQTGRVWLAAGALLAGVVIVLAVVVVVLRELPEGTTGMAREPIPEPTVVPVDVRCPSGTHVLYRGGSPGCEVDNPAVSPAHAEAQWPGGGTTVVLIGQGYKTYFSSNGEPFARLGNGFADSDGDGVTFHPTGSRTGYFKIAGEGGKGYCVDFWAVEGKPAGHRTWDLCRTDQ